MSHQSRIQSHTHYTLTIFFRLKFVNFTIFLGSIKLSHVIEHQKLYIYQLNKFFLGLKTAELWGGKNPNFDGRWRLIFWPREPIFGMGVRNLVLYHPQLIPWSASKR